MSKPNIPTTEESLVYIGSSIKALPGGRIGGYLVVFSTAEDPDLSGDFFTAETDYDITETSKSAVYYAHGLDPVIGKKKLGEGELKMDDAGVWCETQLDLRNKYEQMIYRMAKAGKLGWSSGTAPHLVERVEVRKSTSFIKRWPLGLDASITPTPCEPRTSAIPLKSLDLELVDVTDQLSEQSSIDIKNPSFELPTGSLKDCFEFCLRDVESIVDRLNDVKSLRTSQHRTPLSTENLQRCRVLKSAVEQLIQATEQSLAAEQIETEEQAYKAKVRQQAIESSKDNLDFKLDLELNW